MADDLTLTIRVHDAAEKMDATLSACWEVVKIDRAIIGSSAEGLAKQLIPALLRLKNLRLT